MGLTFVKTFEDLEGAWEVCPALFCFPVLLLFIFDSKTLLAVARIPFVGFSAKLSADFWFALDDFVAEPVVLSLLSGLLTKEGTAFPGSGSDGFERLSSSSE